MENNFYVGIICHKRNFLKREYKEKLVLYSIDNEVYIDLINGIFYTCNNTLKDYVEKSSLILTDISLYKIDYMYLASKYNNQNTNNTKKKIYNKSYNISIKNWREFWNELY